LIEHREFEPYDGTANARMDEKLYHRRILVETVISDLGAQAQVWRCDERPGLVTAVSGAGCHVLGLQRGSGDEEGGDLTWQASVQDAILHFQWRFLQS